MIFYELTGAIRQTIKQVYGIDQGTIEMTEARTGFGDFTTNVAMVLARQVGAAPRDVAQRLVDALPAHTDIAQVEVAGPGFVNITMQNSYWQAQLEMITSDYARSDIGEGKKVQVEYISANPTGPLTIGNARGGFIGEVLCRVLERAGYKVTREYYFNNAGTQISKLLESVKMEAGLLPETAERQYRGEYIERLAEMYKVELGTENDDELKRLLSQDILRTYIEPGVELMGITFDVWFNENDLINDGSFKRMLDLLRGRNLIFERDGATWLRGGELGDEREERVLVKSNGDPTYLAPDLAYHANIFGVREFDYSIKVLGPDHIAQFPSVYAVVHTLFPDKRFRMADYQYLRVVRDGKEVKVSKRAGQFITVQELIEMIGQPVALFLTLMRSADSHMDFDLDLARETSAKNPYYYVMYAYARAHSVLAKAKERGLVAAQHSGELNTLELGLVKQMNRLPGMVTLMAEDFGVHRLTFFGLEMAKIFQEYYESERIIEMPAAQATAKLYVLERFVEFMDIYWSLLGIVPQKRMSQIES